MTPQAKRARDMMKEAGFSLSEFRVRTDTKRVSAKWAPHGYYNEYGNAHIYLRINDKKAASRIPAMVAAGLDVKIFVAASLSHPALLIEEAPTYERPARVQVVDLDALERRASYNETWKLVSTEEAVQLFN